MYYIMQNCILQDIFIMFVIFLHHPANLFETVKSQASLRIAQDKVNPKNYYAYNPEFDGP